MLSTSIEQSQHLLELGLDPKTADMCYEPYISENGDIDITDLTLCLTPYMLNSHISLPAWSLSALLEVMPRPDLYRETADLWVCVTYFKEGTIRGFGETAIDAACDTITKMFGRGYLKKKGYNDE